MPYTYKHKQKSLLWFSESLILDGGCMQWRCGRVVNLKQFLKHSSILNNAYCTQTAHTPWRSSCFTNDKSGLFTAGNDNSAKSEIIWFFFFFGQLVSIIYTLTSYWVVEGYPGEKKGRRGEGGREGGEEEREVGEMRHESEGKCMGRGEKGRRDHFIVPDHPLFVSGNHAWTSVISKLHTYCQFAVWKEGRMLIIMYTHVATPLNIRLGGKWPNTKLYYLRGRPW